MVPFRLRNTRLAGQGLGGAPCLLQAERDGPAGGCEGERFRALRACLEMLYGPRCLLDAVENILDSSGFLLTAESRIIVVKDASAKNSVVVLEPSALQSCSPVVCNTTGAKLKDALGSSVVKIIEELWSHC